MTPPDLVIATAALCRTFSTAAAVRGIDLEVRSGEIYGFLGPNGSGKTTTMRLLIGHLTPTSGYVRVLGMDPIAHPLAVRRRIGIMAENQHFYDDMTALEYLRFFADLHAVRRPAARIEEVLRQTGLWDNRRVLARHFSKGMQQRLALGRALLHDPELVLLDEPVSGLDPHGIRAVRELLLELRAAGKTIFLSSHVISEIERTADRVGIMHQGRLVAQGPTRTLCRPSLEATFLALTSGTPAPAPVAV